MSADTSMTVSDDPTPGCSQSTAQILELADTEHFRQGVLAWDSLQGPGGNKAIIQVIADGVAFVTDPQYGQKLNRFIALGLSKSVTAAELDELEELFRRTSAPMNIHAATIVDSHLEEMLMQRGYAINGSLSEYFVDLKGDGPPIPESERGASTENADITIETVRSTEADVFHDASVEGFRSSGRSPALLSLLARMALQRADTTLFFAHFRGQLAGSAGVSVLEVPPTSIPPGAKAGVQSQKVAELYIDSTLPAFRGKGIHAALIKKRIQYARDQGCSMAMLSARSGSGSARNALKAGMKLAYGKRIYARAIL